MEDCSRDFLIVCPCGTHTHFFWKDSQPIVHVGTLIQFNNISVKLYSVDNAMLILCTLIMGGGMGYR